MIMKTFKGFTFILLALLLALSTNGLAQDKEPLTAEEESEDLAPLISTDVEEPLAADGEKPDFKGGQDWYEPLELHLRRKAV